MADEARHHHYIPQSYLKLFAHKCSERQWYVNVTDCVARRTYPANVRNVCGERDFLRIAIEGEAPDKIEKEMSGFEAKCIEAVRIVANGEDFKEESANLILNLMALLAVRSPEMRENLRRSHEAVAKRVMDLTLADKACWEAQSVRAGMPMDISYEQMKEFHDGDQYKVLLNREYHIRTEFQMMDVVLHELGKRHWKIYRVEDCRGEFITTNRPVTLTYTHPQEIPAIHRSSPGFGLPKTEVFFPLSKNAMLVGRWAGGMGTVHATESVVATINSHMMANSFGKLFSSKPEMLYVDPLSATVRYDDKLLDAMLG